MKLFPAKRWPVRVLQIIAGFSGAVIVFMVIVHFTVFRDTTALSSPTDSTLRVATYNVHYIIAGRDTGAWSVADWERRKSPLSTAIATLEADIIGFQEMETFRWPDGGDENLTLDWLLQQHPTYAAGAVGDPDEFPSTQPIFYRTDRFRLLDQGWFFFSDTPDVIYTRTFNGSFPAFASWIELEDTHTSNTFKVVNIHTDFASYSNRKQSLELVRERIAPWLEAGEAVLVIGDYNAWRGSRLHQTIEAVGLSFAPVTASTYHFNTGLHVFPAIDHVAYSNAFSLASKPTVLQQKFRHEWPTDHHPVVVDIQFR